MHHLMLEIELRILNGPFWSLRALENGNDFQRAKRFAQ